MSPGETLASEQVTELLLRWSEGDDRALDDLIPLVYKDLRRMADLQLRHERTGHTLQPTALVHEAYLKLAERPKVQWQDRAHFLAVAACAMRRVLVDHARNRNRKKRGGKLQILPLDEALAIAQERSTDLLALDEALDRLGSTEPRKARVVELRFFGGLTNEEIASVLGISANTVIRDWCYAQARLIELMRRATHDRGPTQED